MARRQIGREITSIALAAMFALRSDVFNAVRNVDLKRENLDGMFELILSRQKKMMITKRMKTFDVQSQDL